MAAIEKNLIAARAVSELVKRKNWAAREPGVIVVFCIVFVGKSPSPTATRVKKRKKALMCLTWSVLLVAVGLIGLFIAKQCAKRRASKSQI
ncbi:hypothetical protein MKX07_001930 [Trichoderma sp. CBMAI-0711]|nr:hypothetical protein MKX07_001930 [Trichoderma sp. CBMAI-0711]